MPLVAAVSLRYRAGDDVLLEFTVTRDGEPLSLSGMTPRFVAARKAGAAAAVSTEADPPTATATVTNLAGGVYQVAIDDAVTAELLGTYEWQSEIEDANGDVQTVARGYLTFVPKLG